MGVTEFHACASARLLPGLRGLSLLRLRLNSPEFVGSEEPVTFKPRKDLHPAQIFIEEMPQNFLSVKRRGPSNIGAGVIWSCQVGKTEQLGVTHCFIH
jgi:hypothetical protein